MTIQPSIVTIVAKRDYFVGIDTQGKVWVCNNISQRRPVWTRVRVPDEPEQ